MDSVAIFPSVIGPVEFSSMDFRRLNNSPLKQNFRELRVRYPVYQKALSEATA